MSLGALYEAFDPAYLPSTSTSASATEAIANGWTIDSLFLGADDYA